MTQLAIQGQKRAFLKINWKVPQIQPHCLWAPSFRAWNTALKASVMRHCCQFPLSFYALENQGGSNHAQVWCYLPSDTVIWRKDSNGKIRLGRQRLCCLQSSRSVRKDDTHMGGAVPLGCRVHLLLHSTGAVAHVHRPGSPLHSQHRTTSNVRNHRCRPQTIFW